MSDKANVRKVYEVKNEKRANEYLDAGWVLLDTATGRWSDSGEPCVTYVLGWAKDSEIVTPREVY